MSSSPSPSSGASTTGGVDTASMPPAAGSPGSAGDAPQTNIGGHQSRRQYNGTVERFVKSVQFPVSERLTSEEVYERRTGKPRSEVLREHFIKEGRIDEETALRIINGGEWI